MVYVLFLATWSLYLNVQIISMQEIDAIQGRFLLLG